MCKTQDGVSTPVRQDAMLVTVTGIAKKLLTHNASQSFDEIVTDCLHMIGEALGQNRVFIWKDLVNAEGVISCIQIYEWVDGVQPIQGVEEYENIPYDDLPSFRDALDLGQCLNQRVCMLTPSEQGVLDPQGIQTILIAPIKIDGVRWGFIGVDNCHSQELFSLHAENMLLTSGFMLASAILKQATEATLRQSEELVQAMYDATPLCCTVWNTNLEILTCNEGAVELFDLKDKRDFIDNFLKLSPPLQPCGRPSTELAYEHIREAFRTGRTEFEWLQQKLDGEFLPVHVTLVRIRYKNEDAVAGYARDLRELKKQEAQRREAEERTQLMVNAMPLCCNFWDKDFNNIACNDEAARLFELNSQQEYLDYFSQLSPEYQPNGDRSADVAQENISQAFALGYVRFEWLHQRLDGTPIPAEVTLIRLTLQNEYFVVGYTRDLRAHKAMLAEVQAAQQKLALARDEALALSKAKSEFLANMSHEIRTPMNGILGLSYLALQSADMTPQLYEYVTKIDDSAKALLRIINDILDFSKISAGKLDIEHCSFNLPQVLEHTIQSLIPSIMDKGLDIYLDISPNFPMQLVGDAVRLRQILLNLVTNAIKFTRQGGVVIRIEPASFPAAEFLLRFTVSDTGVGIAPDYLVRIFEPFTQADTSVTRRYGGTGLGLAICKQLVTLMGGEISVTSTVDVGSEFAFTACFGMVDASQDESDSESIPQVLNGKHVLIVDDHARSREILTKYMSQAGVNTTCVPNGPTALAALAEQAALGTPCHAVLLDWNTPILSVTLNTVCAIRSECAAPAPGIVAMTYSPAGISLEQKEAGIDAVLAKPVVPATLYRALYKAMEAHGLVPSSPAPKITKPVVLPSRKSMSPLAGKRVLLAEDNEINRIIAVEILQTFGMNVTTAATGLEAMNRALAEPFSVVLMDIQMPEMDGIEATKRLRAEHPSLNNLPIIAMTAHAMADDYDKSIAAGMQAHITKPIDPEELYATLLHWTT